MNNLQAIARYLLLSADHPTSVSEHGKNRQSKDNGKPLWHGYTSVSLSIVDLILRIK
jgi:hypothetical protein